MVFGDPGRARLFRATLVWDSQTPLACNRPYLLAAGEHPVCCCLHEAADGAAPPRGNEAGVVIVETQRPISWTAACALLDCATGETLGIATSDGSGTGLAPALQPAPHGLVVWFTGLSGAGKTTLSQTVGMRLAAQGLPVEWLDGDVVRKSLSRDLGFSREDRDENIRRIGFAAKLLVRAGATVMVAAVSPYRAVRREVRLDIGDFLEVWVNAPLAVCEQRDPKGLYRKARAGLIANFTGIDDPYEPPLQADLECRTDLETIEESAGRVLRLIVARMPR